MAKSTSKSSETSSLSFAYEIAALPSAQHKAGLAGLVLQVDSMRSRFPVESVPDVKMVTPTRVEATFTEVSLGALFDDLYDAMKVKVESPSRWPGAQVLEEREKLDPKTKKTKKVFVYEVVQPRGNFLRTYTDAGKEAWHKLWRDMLWAIPRGKPTTRGPFNARAANEPSGEGPALWKELLAMEKSRAKGESRTCEVAGAILLGAQAVNAEGVPFRDRPDLCLLLHFWQLTVRVFVPEQINADGDREFVGYVLAIPEVSDLKRFVRRYTRALTDLKPEISGYRPRAAVIALPAQGALEFMESLASLASEAVSADLDDVSRALSGVEFFHMVKLGNNIKTAATGRIVSSAKLLRRYEGIKKTSRNPIFLTARILALLRENTNWYSQLAPFFSDRSWPLFVQSQKTPRRVPSFAWDAKNYFNQQIHDQYIREANSMNKESNPADQRPPQKLEIVVYRLVRNYVRMKTEQRSGHSWASFKDRKVKDAKGRERIDYPRAYTEAQEKVCSDLFLGFRSRRDDDFVRYFTDTICAAPQGRILSDESDFSLIARALLGEQERRDVKTLAMLSISAASFSSTNQDDPNEELPELKETTI